MSLHPFFFARFSQSKKWPQTQILIWDIPIDCFISNIYQWFNLILKIHIK